MVKYRKIFYTISLTLVVLSGIFLFQFGLDFGMDFTGGSLMELQFKEPESATSTFALPSDKRIKETLEPFNLKELVVQSAGERGVILRSSEIDAQIQEKIMEKLKTLGSFEEIRFESVGPVLGKEIKEKSVWAIALSLLAILLYIAWAFRGVSYPVSSWKYGTIAIVALFHDILITAGVFALLGYFLKLEVGAPFIAALLTILGYSVNDTIVVFDRVRENITKASSSFGFEDLINKSIRQTLGRSLNTSLTTLLAVLAIFLFGGETTRYFALALFIGITVGTYSSIFIASPLLFSWSMIKEKRRDGRGG